MSQVNNIAVQTISKHKQSGELPDSTNLISDRAIGRDRRRGAGRRSFDQAVSTSPNKSTLQDGADLQKWLDQVIARGKTSRATSREATVSYGRSTPTAIARAATPIGQTFSKLV